MNKALIFGHKSPDTDSICSALIMEDLEKSFNKGLDVATACRLGELNKETKYALDYFKVEAPILIDTIENGTEVILVDHNEFAQSVNNIENAKMSAR